MCNKIETKHFDNGRTSNKNKHDEDGFASRVRVRVSDYGGRCF